MHNSRSGSDGVLSGPGKAQLSNEAVVMTSDGSHQKPEMSVPDFVAKLRREGVAPLQFEQLVARLLAKHLAGDQFSYVSRSCGVDGIAPDGIPILKNLPVSMVAPGMNLSSLPGPTIVATEYRLPCGTDQRNRIVERLKEIAGQEGARSVLLICGQDISQSDLDVADVHLPIAVWDLGHFQSLLTQHVDAVADIAPQLGRAAINLLIERSRFASQERECTDCLTQLRRAYAANELCLFLGAGISMDAGLPSWNTLLSGLMIILLGKESNLPHEQKKELAQALLRANRDSPLLNARYIRAGLAGSFVREVSNCLYGHLAQHTTSAIEAVTRLCMPRRTGPGVRSVITFNFDDLLEQCLGKNGVSCRAIYREGMSASPDELPVYHVHGFLPRDPERFPGVQDAALVFSEEEYHTLMRDPFSWSNLVQLNCLREHTCLFLGLSLTDPNLRRLLDVAAQKNKVPKHYVLLKKISADSMFDSCHRNEAAVPEEILASALRLHHAVVEATFGTMGLNVVWYQAEDEVPALVEELTVSKEFRSDAAVA